MHFKEYTPRLNFLKDSANFLSSKSPSTAAYLMSSHNAIFYEDHRPLNQRLHDMFCGACGSPRKSEHTKVASVKKNSLKRVSPSLAKGQTADGVTIFKCLRCRRRTVTPARISSKSAPLVAPTVDSSAAKTQPAQVSASKTAENASSKKRAKARKQGGLQALLATKQSQSGQSKSLDLFDFLQ
ncbi:hypothetical protein BDW67DRAFT_134338 [Aspergillus spinulosporus]